MKDLLDLYWTYLKIGCVNFGGGYAMLPLLERELANKKGWVTMDELRDYFAIGQCTPGVIALNVSTFVGQKRKGVAGAIAAMLGFLTGPIAIILILAAFLRNFAELEAVQHAFAGIRVCVCVLIVQAVLRLWKKSIVDPFTLALYLVILALFSVSSFTSLLPVKIPAAVLVILAGLAGLAASLLKNKKNAGNLPFLYEMSANHPSWFTHADVADMIAISESTPGAIGINMSTYAGFTTAGIPGGILATLGLALPSVIIILVIAKFLEKFRTYRLVEGAFYGLRPASLAMISVAGLNVARVALVNIPAFQASGAVGDLFLWKAIALGVALFIAQKKLKWHPVIFIAISAVIGIVFRF